MIPNSVFQFVLSPLGGVSLTALGGFLLTMIAVWPSKVEHLINNPPLAIPQVTKGEDLQSIVKVLHVVSQRIDEIYDSTKNTETTLRLWEQLPVTEREGVNLPSFGIHFIEPEFIAECNRLSRETPMHLLRTIANESEELDACIGKFNNIPSQTLAQEILRICQHIRALVVQAKAVIT